MEICISMLKLAAMSVLEKASSQSGMQRGETKSGAVISGDMILKWKRIWSQVAAGLRKSFPAERTYLNANLPLAQL